MFFTQQSNPKQITQRFSAKTLTEVTRRIKRNCFKKRLNLNKRIRSSKIQMSLKSQYKTFPKAFLLLLRFELVFKFADIVFSFPVTGVNNELRSSMEFLKTVILKRTFIILFQNMLFCTFISGRFVYFVNFIGDFYFSFFTTKRSLVNLMSRQR